MSDDKQKPRGKNCSFYHFRLQETDPNDENNLLGFQYFKTAQDICDTYKISRASLYRILKNPEAKTKIPFKIEKIYIHTSAIDLLK
jgi:hypothetical protein